MGKRKAPLYRAGGLTLYMRRTVYHVRGFCGGKRVRQSTGERDIKRASRAMDELLASLEAGWRASFDESESESDWKSVAQWVCNRHRNSSKERGIPFFLQPADVYLAMKESGFRCSVSGIALTKQVKPNGPPDPWSPSIDRIENRHGYTPDNVRVVCLAANLAMNRWGYDVLLRLAKSVVRSSTYVLSETDALPTPTVSQPTGQVIDIIREVA